MDECELIKEVKRAIKVRTGEIWLNLINCGQYGKLAIALLDAAGYYPDNLGPQRIYTWRG